MFPIIGGRKVEQLRETNATLDIFLTSRQIKRVEDSTPFDPGFPHGMIVCVCLVDMTSLRGNCYLCVCGTGKWYL